MTARGTYFLQAEATLVNSSSRMEQDKTIPPHEMGVSRYHLAIRQQYSQLADRQSYSYIRMAHNAFQSTHILSLSHVEAQKSGSREVYYL